jgi:hypothetical protein
MLLRNLMTIIDKILCKLIGVNREEVRPNTVQLVGEKLVIAKTLSFKRHSLNESMDNFNSAIVNQINTENRKKLGLAAGKAIADNLVILFEEPPIKKE